MSDPKSTAISLVIDGRARDLGNGFMVRRVLPSVSQRLVGPFIFFDQMGPVTLQPGEGMDVRPHPHIALATVTYLFAGEIMHRDSVGSVQAIHPGDVNWMVAGTGITHSERSSDETRRTGQRMHGIQSWVALPIEEEQTAPSFDHHPAATIPTVRFEGVVLDVIAGTAYGQRSPVGVLSPTLYVHALLDDGALLAIDEEHEQRAVYVVDGELEVDGVTLVEGQMAVLHAGAAVSVRARGASRVMLVGGAKLEGARHVYWNFVSSDPARIEQAKADWQAGRFPVVPSDAEEFIPLPV